MARCLGLERRIAAVRWCSCRCLLGFVVARSLQAALALRWWVAVRDLYRRRFWICTGRAAGALTGASGTGQRGPGRGRDASYGQFCPVAKAMELLDERWTMLVVRELLRAARTSTSCAAACRRCPRRCCRSGCGAWSGPGVVDREVADGRRSYRLTPAGSELRRRRRAGRLGDPLDRGARRGGPRPAPADVGHPPRRCRWTGGRGAGPCWLRAERRTHAGTPTGGCASRRRGRRLRLRPGIRGRRRRCAPPSAR